MSSARRSLLGLHRRLGSYESSRGRKPSGAIGRDSRSRRLRLEPLEDRSLLSVGVGGMVWNDLNSDGIRDPGEPAVAGAVAEIFSSTDAAIGNADDVSLGAAITDADGFYSFDDLPDSSNYYAVFRSPVGYEFTAQDAGGDDALDSDADAAGVTSLFTIPSGQTDATIDAGLVGELPEFGWALNAGAMDENSCGDAATVDSAGNVYVVGYFGGTADFDSGPGTYNLTSTDERDLFVTKYSSAGALVWARSIGGEGDDDSVSGITLDSQGNVYMAGCFAGTADFDPGSGVTSLTSAGDTDAFIWKLDSAGNYLWAVQIGGEGIDEANDLSLGPDGDVYTIGGFQGTVDFDPGSGDFFLTATSSSYPIPDYSDIFLCKLDSAGGFVWAGGIGGGMREQACGLKVADDGSVYATGGFAGTVDFDPGPDEHLLSFSQGSIMVPDLAAFLSKWDADGNFVWAEMNGIGSAQAIDVAPDGSIYLAGTVSPPFSQYVTGFTYNAFVLKYDPLGTHIWTATTDAGGRFDDPMWGSIHGYGVAVGTDGGVFITGYFYGDVDFSPGSSEFVLDSNEFDSYLLKLDSEGTFDWVIGIGGWCWTNPAIGADGSIYLAGNVYGVSDYDPGPDEFTLTSVGVNDMSLSKILPFSGPADISLSANNVNDGQPEGTVVGVLTTADGESGATFTYTLVPGEGDDDNGSFSIVGNELQTAAVLNAAVKDSYTIRVRSTDYTGQYVEKEFTITVVDVTAPDVELTAPAFVNSGSPEVTATAMDGEVALPDGTEVLLDVDLNNDGDFDDEGELGYITATLADGAATFNVSPELAEGTYRLRARVSDQAGNEGTSDVTTMVVDTTAPTVTISAPSAPVSHGFPVTYTVTYDDPYLDESHLTAGDVLLIRAFVDTAYGTVAVTLLADDTWLVTIYDITGEGTLCIGIAPGTASDLAGNLAPRVLLSEAFTVEYAGPIDLALSNKEIPDNLPVGSLVGTFSTVDICQAAFTYALVEGEGDDDNASFTIDGDHLLTAERFDFSIKNSYSIRVRTTDSHGQSLEKVCTITIVDATAPTVTLVAPTITNDIAPSVTATATEGETVYLDVDLNNDGDFDDQGELGYTTATLADGAAAFNVSPELAEGTYSLRARVSDQAGNEGASDVATMTVDTTPPAISIGDPSADNTESGPVTFTVTYDDPHFDLSTLTAADITLHATGTANGTVTVDGGTGNTRIVTLSDITGEGTLSISIAAGTASDLAGNLAPASGQSNIFHVEPAGHQIADVVVTEAGASNKNGVLESADKILITWAVRNLENAPSVSLFVDGQLVNVVHGPYNTPDGGFLFAGVFGPLEPGTHSFHIQSEDGTAAGNPAVFDGTFEVAPFGPTISHVVVAEAGSGGNHNGTLEAGERLVITWSATSDAGITSKSLTVDGQAVSTLYGPYGVNYAGVFGPLAAGEHAFTIEVTDANGVATYNGTFDVVAAAAAAPQIGNVVVTETANLARDGLLNSEETLVLTWTLTDADGIASKSLSIDGTSVATIYGPYGNAYAGRLGQLAAGTHAYTIQATDTTGQTSTRNGTFQVYAALTLDASPAPIGSVATLTDADLASIAAEAAHRLELALGGRVSTVLGGVSIEIADLPGNLLGAATDDTIQIDRDAAGFGWFVDPTPDADEEFILDDFGSLVARPNTAADGRADLLTAVMHEMGHVLGFDHAADDLMQALLPLGRRRGA